MKILHLYSNWKWTGPAEHALNLSRELQRQGHTVVFACAPPPPEAPDSLAARARQAGIDPILRFYLSKHFALRKNVVDLPRLCRFVQQERFDIVHTHLHNDHLLAGMAVRLTGSRSAVVRTLYEGAGVSEGLRTRLLLGAMTDGLITISERTREQVIGRRYLSARKVWKIDVPIDLERFHPDRVQSNRSRYNLSEEAVVGGIVARVQRHRRFEVLLQALEMVIREFPNFRFMIIGRGTAMQDIAVKPAQAMGIRPNIIFTGYVQEEFPQTLACLNFKVFLVPGSDGSCRAVREALALRIPVIASERGILPELVTNGVDGLIIEDTPEALARAMLFMIEHPDRRCMMAENARQKALRLFDLEQQTKKVAAVYETVARRACSSVFQRMP
ncbi:MAG: glycosyltransferase family 4 protein [Desulfobacterota bacterium]|nr:glycosyltransferase family 4 protein [Thermodesulfobacteriota bacterium]